MLMPGLVMLGSRAAGWLAAGRAGVARKRRARQPAGDPPAAPDTKPWGSALPASLDADQLIQDAIVHFGDVQRAWDAGDMDRLRQLTTPDLLAELLAERQAASGADGCSELENVQARLLGFDALADHWLATVEFSGMIKDPRQHKATPFREVWVLARSVAVGAAATSTSPVAPTTTPTAPDPAISGHAALALTAAVAAAEAHHAGEPHWRLARQHALF